MLRESLSGGLVTARDATLLAPGELTRADDCIYKPGSAALFKAPGRYRFDVNALSGAIRGLVFCQFDSGTDVVLAHSATSYYTAPAGLTPTSFTSLATVLAGDSLDTAHYGNRYVLCNGANANLVLRPDGTTRAHGLSRVTQRPGLALETPGTFPPGSAGVPYYYEYWVTEIVQDGTSEIESDCDISAVETLFVDSANKGVRINCPPERANATATHWAVYRSQLKRTRNERMFPLGLRISKLPLPAVGVAGVLTFLDGDPGSTSATLPTAVTAQTGGAATWTNPNNALSSTDAAAFAQLQFPSNSVYVSRSVYLDFKTFGYTGLQDPIAGLVVDANVSMGAYGWLTAEISLDNGATFGARRTFAYNYNVAGFSLASIGGSTDIDRWGSNITAGGFDNALLVLRITAWQAGGAGAHTCKIDYVKMTVYYNGTAATSAVQFPAVTVILNGIKTSVGQNGKPPVASTVDIFEGSLVMNSITEPNTLYYSVAGNIDAVPALYALTFDTKERDVVRCVRTLGNVLMVFLLGQAWRVNYLPRAADSEFDRGRAVELVDSVNGCVGPKAACRFQLAGGGEQVAFLARSGLRLSDGYHTDTATDDLNWSVLDPGRLKFAEIVNDPDLHCLILYAYHADGVRRAFYFSYHPDHLKNGKLKVSGPVNVEGLGVTNVVLADDSRAIFTGSSDGHVYIENKGATDAAGRSITPIFATRDLYLAGEGNEWKLEKVWMHQAVQALTSYACQLTAYATNAPVRAVALAPVTSSIRDLLRFQFNEGLEAGSLQFTISSSEAASFNYIVLSGEGFGQEDSLS